MSHDAIKKGPTFDKIYQRWEFYLLARFFRDNSGDGRTYESRICLTGCFITMHVKVSKKCLKLFFSHQTSDNICLSIHLSKDRNVKRTVFVDDKEITLNISNTLVHAERHLCNVLQRMIILLL